MILVNFFFAIMPCYSYVGTLGNEAIMVTKDEDVYGLGVNQSGCLGIGDLHSTLLPRRIEALSKKGIKSKTLSSCPFLVKNI